MPCKLYNMYKMKHENKLDYFNDAIFEYKKINESMDMLFRDISDIASNKQFGLTEKQLETFREMIANELYYNYTVLFSPTNTDASPQ